MPGRRGFATSVALLNVAAAIGGGCSEPLPTSAPVAEPSVPRGTSAESAGSSEPTSPSLFWYAREEDRLRHALEDATRAKDESRKSELTASYKDLLAASDAFTEKTVTPEFIEVVPWQDLLGPEMAARWSWSWSRNVPGFGFRVADGVLKTTPPDQGSGLQGVFSIVDGPRDDLRHFVLDMEFSVEGRATMLFHVDPRPTPPDNRKSFAYDLDATSAAGLKPGATYGMAVSYIGSRLRVSFGEGSGIQPWSPDPAWFKRRTGGIAFVIPEGARLTITRMRIKRLPLRPW